jgi:polyhydroxybutyrate depolymerase
LIKYANTKIVLAGPLAAWLTFGCGSSSETPTTEPSTGGTAQSGGTQNSSGLPSQIGGAGSAGTAAGSTNTGGTYVGGMSSGGNAAGGKANASSAGTGGASGGTSTGGSAASGTSGDSTGTTGCNGNAKPPTSPAGSYLTIDVNGTSREYLLELPNGYDGKTAEPVLFAFHGTGSGAQEFIGDFYGGVRKGAAGRVILVGPMGLSRNGQTGWVDVSGSSLSGIAQVDIDFFDALVAKLKANYCVDTRRIFSMGHSAGAYLSNQLGCIRSNVLRGVGPFAGGGPDEFGSVTCGGKVAAFIGHNPKEGDPAECAKMSGGTCPWTVKWADSGWPTTQFWTKKDSCNDPGAMPTAVFAGNSTTGNPLPCQAYAGCDPNYPVTLCLYDYWDQWDGPHAFPVQWGAKAVTDFFLALPKLP